MQRPAFAFHSRMYLLYLDESGNDPRLPWFVLAGVSVPERQAHWIEQDLNDIAARFSADEPHAVELHGNPMHKGNGRWRRVERARRTCSESGREGRKREIGMDCKAQTADGPCGPARICNAAGRPSSRFSHPRTDFEQVLREQAIADALHAAISQRHGYGVRLFAAVIQREKTPAGKQPIDLAFEQISARFDQMLTRLNRKAAIRKQPAQRGLILFDKASNELTIQSIAREFKYSGHQWGRTRNYAEVPVFLDSASSRLIQLADLVAYAVYQHFAHQNPLYFRAISRCFDSDGLREHGLYTLP